MSLPSSSLKKDELDQSRTSQGAVSLSKPSSNRKPDLKHRPFLRRDRVRGRDRDWTKNEPLTKFRTSLDEACVRMIRQEWEYCEGFGFVNKRLARIGLSQQIKRSSQDNIGIAFFNHN